MKKGRIGFRREKNGANDRKKIWEEKKRGKNTKKHGMARSRLNDRKNDSRGEKRRGKNTKNTKKHGMRKSQGDEWDERKLGGGNH